MTIEDLRRFFDEVLPRHNLGLIRYGSGGNEEISPHIDDADAQEIIDDYNCPTTFN